MIKNSMKYIEDKGIYYSTRSIIDLNKKMLFSDEIEKRVKKISLGVLETFE